MKHKHGERNRLRHLKEMVRDAAESINDVWDEFLDDEMNSIQIAIDELEDEVIRNLDTESLPIQEDGCPDLELLNALRRVLMCYGSDDHFIDWMDREIKKYPLPATRSFAPATLGAGLLPTMTVVDPILNLEDIKWV